MSSVKLRLEVAKQLKKDFGELAIEVVDEKITSASVAFILMGFNGDIDELGYIKDLEAVKLKIEKL